MITFQGSTTLCKFSMNSISNRLRVSSMKYHLYIIYDKFLQNHKLRKVTDFIHVDKYIRDICIGQLLQNSSSQALSRRTRSKQAYIFELSFHCLARYTKHFRDNMWTQDNGCWWVENIWLQFYRGDDSKNYIDKIWIRRGEHVPQNYV